MGARIDELEKSIGELMTQAGIEVLIIPGTLLERINQRLFCPFAYIDISELVKTITNSSRKLDH